MTRKQFKNRALFILNTWPVELLAPCAPDSGYHGPAREKARDNRPGCLLQIVLDEDGVNEAFYTAYDVLGDVNLAHEIAHASDSQDERQLRALIEAL
jgi:hypothetical protein